MRDAYADFCTRVDDSEETAIDPYAAENPGEFFAVLSEVFFRSSRCCCATSIRMSIANSRASIGRIPAERR